MTGRRIAGQILRGYDPFAHAALAPFGFSADAELSLLSLSENATYRVDDPRTGGPPCCGCTGPATTRPARSPPSWPGCRRCAGTRGCSPRRCSARRTAGRWSTSPSDRLTRQTVLFECVPGTEPPEDQLAEKFELLGEICARMHRHSRGWARPASFRRFRWDFDCCVGATPLGPLAGRHRGGPGRGTGDAGAARPALMRDAAAQVRHRARTGSGSSTPTCGWPTCWSAGRTSRSSTSTTAGSAGSCSTSARR